MKSKTFECSFGENTAPALKCGSVLEIAFEKSDKSERERERVDGAFD